MSHAVIVASIILALLGLLASAVLILRRHVETWVAIWNQVLEPFGGKAEPHIRFQSVLRATVPLSSDVTLEMEQWKGGGALGFGQIVARLSSPRYHISPFFCGADAWASALCRWGLSLPAFATELVRPLDQGRARVPEAAHQVLSPSVALGLRAVKSHFVCGRGNTITIHVPGGVETPTQKPRLEALLKVAREIAENLEQ